MIGSHPGVWGGLGERAVVEVAPSRVAGQGGVGCHGGDGAVEGGEGEQGGEGGIEAGGGVVGKDAVGFVGCVGEEEWLQLRFSFWLTRSVLEGPATPTMGSILRNHSNFARRTGFAWCCGIKYFPCEAAISFQMSMIVTYQLCKIPSKTPTCVFS